VRFRCSTEGLQDRRLSARRPAKRLDAQRRASWVRYRVGGSKRLPASLGQPRSLNGANINAMKNGRRGAGHRVMHVGEAEEAVSVKRCSLRREATSASLRRVTSLHDPMTVTGRSSGMLRQPSRSHCQSGGFAPSISRSFTLATQDQFACSRNLRRKWCRLYSKTYLRSVREQVAWLMVPALKGLARELPQTPRITIFQRAGLDLGLGRARPFLFQPIERAPERMILHNWTLSAKGDPALLQSDF
jgi:hypothetical protein